jgi:hypothetical protein
MKIQIKATDIQRRNPVARELASAQFRSRTVRDKTKYTRKTKHRRGDE